MSGRLLQASRVVASALEGKAINPALLPAPAGGGLPISTPGVPNIQRMSQREARAHAAAYGGTQAIDTVNDCVNVYTDHALGAPWHFAKPDGEVFVARKGPDQPADAKEAPEELVKLLEQPNPWQDYGELLTLTIIDFLLVGNFYWLKWKPIDGTEKPAALYRLNPADVTVIPGKKDLIDAYEYYIPGRPEPVRFDADLVVHGRRPNPHNPYLGLGLMAAGARMLDIELGLTETMAQFFENGAKLSGVLQSDRRVPDPVFKKLTTQFRSLYSGSRNAYKIAVLEQGLKFQSIQPTAAESEFQKLSLLSFQRQCRLFRMPPELLGGETQPGVMQESKRIFADDTMRPFLNRLQKLISLGLTRPGWDLDFVIDYKYVMPTEDRMKLIAGMASIPGIKVNEVRDYAGLPPLDDSVKDPDEPGKPLGDKVLNLPDKSTELGGDPNRPLPGQPGRPPNPGNVKPMGNAGSARPGRIRGGAAAPRPKGTGAASGQAAGRKALEETIARLDDVLSSKALARGPRYVTPVGPDDGSDLLEAPRVQLVDDATTLIASGLSSAAYNLERSILDHITEGKSLTKADRPRVVDAVDDSPAWATFNHAKYQLLASAARASLGQAAAHYAKANAATVRDIGPEADALATRPEAQAITTTLRDRVIGEVAEGVRRGYSTRQLLDGYPEENFDGVRSQIDHWRENQIQTIALTEAQVYYNEGVLRVGELAGYTHVRVHDGDGDEACAEAAGAVWPLEHARQNLIAHPNCRRGFTLIREAA